VIGRFLPFDRTTGCKALDAFDSNTGGLNSTMPAVCTPGNPEVTRGLRESVSIDGMKRLASRLTRWHTLPHKSTDAVNAAEGEAYGTVVSGPLAGRSVRQAEAVGSSLSPEGGPTWALVLVPNARFQ